MKVIIIEDEKPAAEKLQRALLQIKGKMEVSGISNSIAASVVLLQQQQPDLLFMDIELTDGLSFEIFDKVSITCPVIFTTAYDDYWQTAFEHNSIDYLLKPIKQEKLEAALKKYALLKQHFATNFQQLLQWQQNESTATYKKRFLVKRGVDYVAVKAEDIAYCYATHKLVCMVNKENQKFILDKSITDLEKELNPAQFHRVNRKYLVNINAVKRIRSFAKGKLLIDIQPAVEEEIIVSNENTAAFKEWMGG
ncbi:LytTR family DNA-binding domain-containing protein [soil metagenome]